MAKSNKNFKKPVNNQEIVIDEEDKNKNHGLSRNHNYSRTYSCIYSLL